MLNGGGASPHRSLKYTSKKPSAHELLSATSAAAADSRRPPSSLVKKTSFPFSKTASDLACKVPLVVGAIIVLLVINTTLQYAAGPALRQALPVHGSRGGSGSNNNNLKQQASNPHDTQQQQQQHSKQHLLSKGAKPLHGLPAGVIPGGADAELLCVDKQTGCNKK